MKIKTIQLSLVNIKRIKTNPTPISIKPRPNKKHPPLEKKAMQKKEPNVVIQNNFRSSSDNK